MRASPAPASIRLRSPPAVAGLLWIRRGFRTFWRRPLGFFGLYLFVVACLVVAVLSPFALLILIVLLPMLSLGFMLATEDVLNDLPLRPSVFWAPLLMTKTARRGLLTIGLVYVATSIAIALLADSIDGGEARRWAEKLMTPRTDGQMPDVPPLSALGTAVLLFKSFGVALVSIPLWHAPALVHWGRQGVAQAMFSSVVAIWRTRAAFAMFVVGWITVALGFAMLIILVAAAFGAAAVSLAAFTCLVALTATFYVSIWFGFVDTFEIAPPVAFHTVAADNDSASS
ncbi:MAG: BPSS1780 family membrane protein [Vitreoscilla sp.]